MLATVDSQRNEVEEELEKLIEASLETKAENDESLQWRVMECECKVGLGLRLIAKAKARPPERKEWGKRPKTGCREGAEATSTKSFVEHHFVT